MSKKNFTRKRFLQSTGAAIGGTLLAGPLLSHASAKAGRKMRVALVGTGVRGVGMYGRNLLENYSDYVDMVGVCDQNPGRLEYGREYIGTDAPGFTDLTEMLARTDPDWLIVTTWDWEHHNNIIEGLENGCDIICEKPITIDEQKAQMILDAEKKYDNQIYVTFNYRYPPHRSKVKELLMNGAIGELTSVDFHWNISHSHLQRYMQRWHGQRDRGGTLWVHKSTHHFDMLNWFLDSDPEEVFAYADLERFGPRGPFRGANCRNCAHTAECPYYWDITESEHLTKLYVENENYDGYIRDNCVFRREIDIYDKHSALIKYANNVYVNYSLTADTDHSGYWIAFNGTKGRIEGREGGWQPDIGDYQEWQLQVRGEDPEVIRVDHAPGGHWGGDPIMMSQLFTEEDPADPMEQLAGVRDGLMSILIGVAARKSADAGKPVKIAGLTDLKPVAKRP